MLGFRELFLLDACDATAGFCRASEVSGVGHGKIGIDRAIFATYSFERTVCSVMSSGGRGSGGLA